MIVELEVRTTTSPDQKYRLPISSPGQLRPLVLMGVFRVGGLDHGLNRSFQKMTKNDHKLAHNLPITVKRRHKLAREWGDLKRKCEFSSH